MEKLVVIDGNSLANRAFYALPILTNSSGEYCNMLYGFCNLIIKIITDEKPSYLAVCFDAGKHTFRHDLYAEYKGTRKGMPKELAEQLPNLKKILDKMGIFHIEMPNIEADDLVGSICAKFNTKNIIFSGDRDLLQLINDNTEVHLTKRGVSDVQILTKQNLKEVMGYEPYQVIELKALMGDSSDNIPGVSGVGDKTALTLINDYNNLDNIYSNIENIKGKLKEKLIDGEKSARLSKTLATINTKVDIDIKLEDLKYEFPFNCETLEVFKHYEFESLIKRTNLFNSECLVNKIENEVVKQVIDNQFDLQLFLQDIKQTNLMSIFIDENVHISLSKFKEYILDCGENKLSLNDVLNCLKPVLENSEYKKVCFDIKKLKHQLSKFNINLENAVFDITLANYLINGSDKNSDTIGYYQTKYSFDETSKASIVLYLYDKFLGELKNSGMEKLYYDLEFPLINVLFDMEQNGFKLDKKYLYELGETYKNEVESLNREIQELAGVNFNLNSPKQLGEVLFDKLMLPKTKRANSTSVEVLEKLIGVHPIIEKILRYRKIYKLSATYIEDFKKMLDSENLIHTEFNQTLTSTGRLSSKEPNLQNIPIRDEEGKFLRKLFISRFENGSIISADYSQIELRLLAHYSLEPKLVKAYNDGVDIHSQTASEIFGKDINEITPLERRRAKAVNFGIIYGISEYGLSQSINSTPKEAKMFMEKYFETYPFVKTCMNNAVDFARQNGYAISLLGRKREIKEINAENKLVKQFGERVAMNMPLQGTAADIIKLAMIKVSNELKKQNLKSKLVLQIHDELIIDTYNGEEEKVKQILKENMENCIKLNVPLVVDISEGKTLYEA